MKIYTVIGARPQFIKASAVSRAIQESSKLSETIIHTGQHFDKNMSDIFFSEMNIPEPMINLDLGSLSHGAMTGRQLEKLEDIFSKESPDLVLVYGDTNSTLSASLAAAKIHIPVAHIEAGLRSFNKKMPEEINRIISDHLSDFLFVPSEEAKKNLINEGIDEVKIHNVGDVMFDATKIFSDLSEKRSNILSELRISPKQYILSTIHRPENTDHPQRLKNIFEAFNESQREFIIPLHPRTKKILMAENIAIGEKIKIIDPVGYLDMISLQKNANLIASDSGGIQKEAFFYKVPCITLRDETEWIETVEAGMNKIVSADKNKILKALSLVEFTDIKHNNPYGDGNSSYKIVKILEDI